MKAPQMSIILEGYDGHGKSTLAKRLATEFRMPIIQAGPPACNDGHAIICARYQLSWMTNRPCVFDRVTPISRTCYQTGNSAKHLSELASIWIEMAQKSVLVWCNSSKIAEHVIKPHDTAEHLRDLELREKEIEANYAALMSDLHHYRYDWTLDSTSGRVIDYLRREIHDR